MGAPAAASETRRAALRWVESGLDRAAALAFRSQSAEPTEPRRCIKGMRSFSLRRVCLCIPLAAVALAWMTSSALAGGWAVTTLDSVPTDIRAGQTYRIGYMIRQHGATPLMGATPQIRISRAGEGLAFPGWPDGTPGHYVSEVNFPTDGEWSWSVDQSPFAAQVLGTLSIASAPATEAELATQAEPSRIAPPEGSAAPEANVAAVASVAKVQPPVELAMAALVVLALGGVATILVVALPRTVRTVTSL
jgi:hypothetical protein